MYMHFKKLVMWSVMCGSMLYGSEIKYISLRAGNCETSIPCKFHNLNETALTIDLAENDRVDHGLSEKDILQAVHASFKCMDQGVVDFAPLEALFTSHNYCRLKYYINKYTDASNIDFDWTQFKRGGKVVVESRFNLKKRPFLAQKYLAIASNLFDAKPVLHLQDIKRAIQQATCESIEKINIAEGITKKRQAPSDIEKPLPVKKRKMNDKSVENEDLTGESVIQLFNIVDKTMLAKLKELMPPAQFRPNRISDKDFVNIVCYHRITQLEGRSECSQYQTQDGRYVNIRYTSLLGRMQRLKRKVDEETWNAFENIIDKAVKSYKKDNGDGDEDHVAVNKGTVMNLYNIVTEDIWKQLRKELSLRSNKSKKYVSTRNFLNIVNTCKIKGIDISSATNIYQNYEGEIIEMDYQKVKKRKWWLKNRMERKGCSKKFKGIIHEAIEDYKQKHDIA